MAEFSVHPARPSTPSSAQSASAVPTTDCADCGHGRFLRDQALVVSDGSLSPGCADGGQSGEQGADRGSTHPLWPDSDSPSKRVDRCAEGDGAWVLAAIEAHQSGVVEHEADLSITRGPRNFAGRHRNRHQRSRRSGLVSRTGWHFDLNLLKATPGIETAIAVLQFRHVCS